MILKCWKKRRNPNYEYVFEKENLQITIDDTKHGMFKPLNRYYLEVFRVRPYKKVMSRMFKTKSAALKFAKSYMRRN